MMNSGRIAGELEIEAACKINLHLAVGARRADGFHEIESLFAALGPGDTLRFSAGGSRGSCELLLEGEGAAALRKEPPEGNLVCRAVALFRDATGFSDGLRIRLVKRTPLGAGLGGGSSDAAATLLALNRRAGEPLDGAGLAALAAALGSDVPFFLTGGAAWVTGRGDRVAPLAAPGSLAGLTVLLLTPPFPSDTPLAYRRLDEARRAAAAPPPPGRFDPADLPAILNRPPEEWPFSNDFLPVLPEAGVYRGLIALLRERGAAFAGLSGSGSTCFGVFTRPEAARRLAGQAGKFSANAKKFLARKAVPVLQ